MASSASGSSVIRLQVDDAASFPLHLDGLLSVCTRLSRFFLFSLLLLFLLLDVFVILKAEAKLLLLLRAPRNDLIKSQRRHQNETTGRQCQKSGRRETFRLRIYTHSLEKSTNTQEAVPNKKLGPIVMGFKREKKPSSLINRKLLRLFIYQE